MHAMMPGRQGRTLAPTVRFVTMGCAKNEVDTDTMRASLRAAGYVVPDDDDATGATGFGDGADEAAAEVPPDVIIVNTCSFITEATQESIDAIFAVLGQRQHLAASTKVIVAGCMPARYGSELAAQIPEVDAFVPVADEPQIASVVAGLVGPPALPARAPDAGGRTQVQPAATEDAQRTLQAPWAYLKISDGCSRHCSFCTIPGIRGPYASRTAAQIIGEAEHLVQLGAREIILIGQDTGIWGTDFAGTPHGTDPLPQPTLAALLDYVARRWPDTWFRVMYLQPQGITDELLHTMAAHAKICDYLDIPLQHCNARVLRDMNRAGQVDDYLRLLERIRAIVGDDVALRTTFIAGFPGETDDEADELAGFAEQAGFEFGGVFAYSREDGTAAGQRTDQVPEEVKARRAQELGQIVEQGACARAASRVGQVHQVLVCGVGGHDDDAGGDDAGAWGRTMFQAPDVDGVTLIGGDAARALRVGDIVRVRIVGSVGCDLEGELA